MCHILLSASDNINPPVGVRTLSVFGPTSAPHDDDASTWADAFIERLRSSFCDVVCRHFRPVLGRLCLDARSTIESGGSAGEHLPEDEKRIFAILDIPTDEQEARSSQRCQQLLQRMLTVQELGAAAEGDEAAWAPALADMAAGNLCGWPIAALECQYSQLDGPLLLVKVTKVVRPSTSINHDRGGGEDDRLRAAVIITTAINHSCGDAASTGLFLRTWAELARTGEVQWPPCHDRSLMRITDPAVLERSVKPPPYGIIPMEYLSEPNMLVLARAAACGEYRIRYDASVLDEARAKLNDAARRAAETKTPTGRGVAPSFSKNDVMVANLWQSVARATLAVATASELEQHQKPADGGVTLYQPVNVRGGRCKKPNILPDEYFGNAIFGAVARAASLSAVAEMPFENIVELVHGAVRGIADDPSAIEDVIAWETHRGRTGAREPGCPSAGAGGLAVSSWLHMGLESNDFGFGRPLIGTHLNLPGPFPSLVVVSPVPRCAALREPDAAFDLGAGLPHPIAAALRKDSGFLGRFVGLMHAGFSS